MDYSKYIINKEDTTDNDLKVITRYINDYINYREFRNNPIKHERNECFKESLELNRYLNSRRVRSNYVKGFFVVEDPSKMDLTIADIMPSEMDDFTEFAIENFNIFEDDFEDINSDFEKETGYSENEIVQAYANSVGYKEFDTYPHGWVEINGIMIDMTMEQFENACPSGITKLNYIRG